MRILFEAGNVFKASLTPQEKLMKSPYLVALMIVRARKAHTIVQLEDFNSTFDNNIDRPMCETILNKECSANWREYHCLITNGRREQDMTDEIKL